MKNNTKLIRLVVIALLTIYLFSILASCKKDEIPEPIKQPENNCLYDDGSPDFVQNKDCVPNQPTGPHLYW